jgi:hypothetical protein
MVLIDVSNELEAGIEVAHSRLGSFLRSILMEKGKNKLRP